MEAINALHNKLQSLEEELSNAQQHSHHIDEEIAEIRQEREEELERIDQVAEIINRNNATLNEKQEQLQDLIVNNDILKTELESCSVAIHQLLKFSRKEHEAFSKISARYHSMMEKLYTGVKTHNFLDNDKTEDLKISVNNKFDADKFCMDIATQVDALKHEWKEKMILKDMGYCCEEEKLMQQINKESLELSLLQDYIENGNRVSYDSTLKGVDEFKQNSEKATPVLNTSTPPNPAQINSHTIMEQEIVQLFTNATEIVESFEVVVTPWYQEFKRRRLDVVTEEQQFYQSNQQESFKVSTDSFQTCWDLLQYEQV